MHVTKVRSVPHRAARLARRVASVPGEPVVTRICYMRFAGAPHGALIVMGQRQPIYFTFANRNK